MTADSMIFDSLILQYETLREERAGSESRELQVISTITSVYLILFPIGIELQLDIVLVLMPVILFMGYLGYIWFGISYITKTLCIRDVQDAITQMTVIDLFEYENTVQDEIRTRTNATFVIPMMGISSILVILGVAIGFWRLVNSGSDLLLLLPIIFAYGILGVIGAYIHTRGQSGIKEVEKEADKVKTQRKFPQSTP